MRIDDPDIFRSISENLQIGLYLTDRKRGIVFWNRGDYTNWELSADRANAARRLMQNEGLAPKQVLHIRGYADERLRKPDAPFDPSNRRISVIVQYIVKNDDDDKPPTAINE